MEREFQLRSNPTAWFLQVISNMNMCVFSLLFQNERTWHRGQTSPFSIKCLRMAVSFTRRLQQGVETVNDLKFLEDGCVRMGKLFKGESEKGSKVTSI